MPQINLQVNALGFSDNQLSNNPLIRNFDLTFKLFGIQVENPEQKMYNLAPGEARTIYDGSRTLLVDNTTAFDVSRPVPSENTYRLTASAGTDPGFRTDRASGATTSTTFTLSVNGPVSTLTATAGPFSTASVQVGDIVKLESGVGCSASNQGEFTVIGFTSNSISFINPDAAGESWTVLDASKLYLYSNGGGTSNQVQIGDTVIISAGFSPATQGQYVITDVTPKWIEFSVGSQSGLPIETGILPGASGIVIYSAAKKFVLVAAQDKMSARFNADTSDNSVIEPMEAGNPEKPGLLLKNGPLYKLVVKNLSLSPAHVTVASGE